MPSSRWVIPGSKSLDALPPTSLRARVYSTSELLPCTRLVETYDDPTRCFPTVETLFGGIQTQSAIHDQEVVIYDNGSIHRFVFFFKNHVQLPLNQTVRWAVWRGDLIVMRRANHGSKTYVNIRADDADRIDFAVKSFVEVFVQTSPIRRGNYEFIRTPSGGGQRIRLL